MSWGFLKIASVCTTGSYDLQKGYPLKCAGRLDKNFWRGIIDLQDRLEEGISGAGGLPAVQPKAVKPRTIKIRRQGKAEPGEDPGAGTRGRPGTRLSGAGTGKTRTPTDPREGAVAPGVQGLDLPDPTV